MTVLLLNLNSNFIPYICQLGLMQESRFLGCGLHVLPRCSNAQQRDCPPDFANLPPHKCSYSPPCESSLRFHPILGVLSAEAIPFEQGCGSHVVRSVPVCRDEAPLSTPGIALHGLSPSIKQVQEPLDSLAVFECLVPRP